MCNVIARRVPDDAFRQALELQKARFSGKYFQSAIRISANNVVLNSGETLDKWLNAFEYHRDLDKQAFIRDLHQMLPLDDGQAVYLQLLSDRAVAVFNLSKICDLLLGRTNQLQIGGTGATEFPSAG